MEEQEEKPKRSKKSDEQLKAIITAAEIALDYYRKTHDMKNETDFSYPGFKELYNAINKKTTS